MLAIREAVMDKETLIRPCKLAEEIAFWMFLIAGRTDPAAASPAEETKSEKMGKEGESYVNLVRKSLFEFVGGIKTYKVFDRVYINSVKTYKVFERVYINSV